MPDSHLNAYVRFKLVLTERQPTIRPYDQDAWAALSDSKAPIEMSLDLVDAVHRRLVVLLRAIPEDGWPRTLTHPESGIFRLDQLLALYAWHGRHHAAHVTGPRQRKGW